MLAVAAERGALAALEGSCRTAISAHAASTPGRRPHCRGAQPRRDRQSFRRMGGTAALGDDAAETAARALGDFGWAQEIVEAGAATRSSP